jgi:hypothetical protein
MTICLFVILMNYLKLSSLSQMLDDGLFALRGAIHPLFANPSSIILGVVAGPSSTTEKQMLGNPLFRWMIDFLMSYLKLSSP